MATIVDYASLKQAVLDFSHRASLSAYIDYFIQDGEDRVYRKVLELNEGNGLRWMEATLSLTINATSGYAAVPADYLALKGAQVVVSGANYDLTTKDSQWIYDRYPTRSAQGAPSFIAREINNFIFGPFPDSAYSVVGTYFQRAAALSSTNTTTWMTTNIPLTLFAACMASVSKFLKDTQAMEMWMSEMTDRLTGIISADKAEQYAGGQLQISAVDSVPGVW